MIRSGDHREFEHPFYQVVLDGIKRRASAAGYDLFVLSHEGEDYGEDSAYFVRRARRHQVDGAILMGILENDVESLAKTTIPIVIIDAEFYGPVASMVGIVQSDNSAGAELAVNHLFGLGRRRIATITGLPYTSAGAKRLAGYRNALEGLGLPYREEYVVEGDFTHLSGCSGMRALLKLSEPPDAVFAAGDLMALGAMRAVHDSGLRVPDDIAMVGFDDIRFASFSVPALTTIRQHKEKLGATACEVLIELIEGRMTKPPSLTLPVELIVRESCGGGGQPSASDPFSLVFDESF